MSVHVQWTLFTRRCGGEGWGLGGGKQEVGGPYLVGAVILGVPGAQVLSGGAGGKVDVAGGA